MLTRALLVLICCPTRDRPKFLQKTLESISHDLQFMPNYYRSLIIVVDDSIDKKNQICNREIAEKNKNVNVIYHGFREQQNLLRIVCCISPIRAETLKLFIRNLGAKSWDLGAVRNYTLLLANIWGEENCIIVMIDDDTIIALPKQVNRQKQGFIAKMMQLVEQNNLAIVGARLEGVPDASTLERACLKFTQVTNVSCFKLPKRSISISGGSMAFSMHWAARVPFPRTYNEDWIWMSCCSILGGRLVKSRLRAKHSYSYKAAANYKDLYRELIGEIFFEGWDQVSSLNKDSNYCYRVLRKESHWAEVIREELYYLSRVKGSFVHAAKRYRKNRIKKPLQRINSIIDKTHSIMNMMQPAEMVRLANDYIINTSSWREITQKLRKISYE